MERRCLQAIYENKYLFLSDTRQSSLVSVCYWKLIQELPTAHALSSVRFAVLAFASTCKQAAEALFKLRRARGVSPTGHRAAQPREARGVGRRLLCRFLRKRHGQHPRNSRHLAGGVAG